MGAMIALDLVLHNGATCFVAEVMVRAGDCGPAKVIACTSRNGDEWIKYQEFECTALAGQWHGWSALAQMSR